MNNHVQIFNNPQWKDLSINRIAQTMSSREVAELTGKRHDHVLRDCDNLNETYEKMGLPKLGEGYYTHSNTGSQQHREYKLTKMQTFDLLTGYKTDLRIKVNRRWEELEQQQLQPQTKALPQNYKEALLALVAEVEVSEKLQGELDGVKKEVARLKPKADLMDKVLDADQRIDVGQAAKILQLPFDRNTLFAELRKKGVFFSNRNEPKQEYIKRGYFELKEKWIERDNHDGFVVVKVLVTQRGLDFIARLFEVVPAQSKLVRIT